MSASPTGRSGTTTHPAARPPLSPPPPPPELPTRLGAGLHRWRWPILVAGLVVIVVGAVWGTGAFARLTGGGFDTPGSESDRAAQVIEDRFGRQDADVAVVYASPDRTVDDPAFRAEVEATLATLPAADVASVTTLWSSGSPALASTDRRETLVLVQLAGDDDEAREAAYKRIADRLVAPDLETLRGGAVPTFVAINDRIAEDLARAETLSAPILLVLLVVVFGSLVAAGLPLLVGVLAILGAFTALNVISRFTDVSVYSINIVIMLGLGLAIDYALFVVSRFREELAARGGQRPAVPVALGATMRTAGRTVVVSGVTVAVSLAALLFFPQGFLRSMAYGAIAAVVIALVAALTVLPAMLAILGPRVDAVRIGRRPRLPMATEADGETGAWARLARGVMRRPGLVAGAVTLVLVVLTLPALGLQFGGVDTRVLPVGTESRVASERVAAGFPAASTSSLDVVLVGASAAEAEAYATTVAELPDATSATVVGSSGDDTLVVVGHRGDPAAEAAQDLVTAVRDVPAPAGAEVLVGGAAAAQADTLASLGDRLPWAAGFVVIATIVLLFLAFGSVLLPVKAVLMAVLSLGAMFGVVVWIFQEGNLASWFGVTPTGTVEATQPVLMVAIAFGLSMDYEVFLLSRIREEWDRTGDNTRAVAVGLQRTGRIITSAALLLVVVIGAFATSGISFITMIGVGLAVAIAIDATLIRALLVPATMRLLGSANWWAPAPLRRVYERVALERGRPADA